tara:strand:- start:137 stop:562 length:426 start_codon:yes stop_codon:yes gene_type:complete
MSDLKKNTLLWLDDNRDPATSPYLNKFCPEFVEHQMNIIWVKTFNEFEMWILNNGFPSKISFDHDLANEHYAPPNRYNDYHSWVGEQEFKEKTGMDAAKWVIEYCLDYNQPLPEWSVHSANPPGAENITKLLLNFMKYQKQ